MRFNLACLMVQLSAGLLSSAQKKWPIMLNININDATVQVQYLLVKFTELFFSCLNLMS